MSESAHVPPDIGQASDESNLQEPLPPPASDTNGNGRKVTMTMPPPPAPPPSALGRDVKVSMSGPLTSVVESVGRLSQQQHQAAHLETPGLTPRFRGMAQFLNDLVNDNDRTNWTIETNRTGPAVWDGIELPTGAIDRCNPLSYVELHDRIRSMHGGGSYRVNIMDDMGKRIQQFPFNIDTLQEAPKLPASGQQQRGYAIGGRSILPGANALQTLRPPALLGEEDEVTRLRNEERRLAAQETVKDRQYQIEDKEKKRREQEEREREQRETRALAPIQHVQNQVQTMERTMLEMQRASDARIAQIIQASQTQMTQMMQMVTAAPKDNALTTILPLMMEMMKSSSQQTVALMNAMMTSGNHGKSEAIEAAKLQMEQQGKMFETMLRTQTGGNSRYDKIIETVLANTLSHKGDPVKDAMQMMELGRRQTIEMLELREEYGGGKKDEDDEFSWNEEAGVGSNIAKMLFGMLKMLMKGGGGAQGMALLMQLLNRNNLENVPAQDMKNLAVNLEARYGKQAPDMLADAIAQQRQQQLPGPAVPDTQAGRPAFGAPPNRRVVVPPPTPAPKPEPVAVQQPAAKPAPDVRKLVIFDEILEDDQPEVVQVEVQVEQVQVQAQVAAPVAAPVSAPVPVKEITVPDDPKRARLVLRVSEAMQICLTEDIEDGVRVHSWVDQAIDTWPKAFLDQIVSAKDDTDRLTLIKDNCDPGLWGQLYVKLMDGSQPQNYQNFIAAVATLVNDHKAATPGV